jgi:hypothetical protein
VTHPEITAIQLINAATNCLTCGNTHPVTTTTDHRGLIITTRRHHDGHFPNPLNPAAVTQLRALQHHLRNQQPPAPPAATKPKPSRATSALELAALRDANVLAAVAADQAAGDPPAPKPRPSRATITTRTPARKATP